MNTTSSVGCPTAVTITPSTGPFSAGDVLTCEANGFPEPSFEWIDINGVVISPTNTVTLLEGPFRLTCKATGNLAGQCSASDSISGDAKSKYRKHLNTLEIILMLIALGCRINGLSLLPKLPLSAIEHSQSWYTGKIPFACLTAVALVIYIWRL